MVQMMCMTTKQKFEVENPPVIKLQNGRYAYRAECPWKGKNDRTLVAFKFCSEEAYNTYNQLTSEDNDENGGN